ncbi:MAG: thioredoxin family protein [bacterium]|nr:thioredoxin family protein [bacterium]
MKGYVLISIMFLTLFIIGCPEDKPTQPPPVSSEKNPPIKIEVNTKLPETENKNETVSKTIKEEKEEIKVTFIELGSVKCVPCKMMQPVMEEIEKEYAGQVKVVFHDVWTKEGKPYGEKYKVRAIPTQVFLDKNGKEFHRHVGFYAKDKVVEVLKTQGVK